MIDISTTKVDVPCPKCKSKNSLTLNQIQQQQTIICSGCKTKITLVDKSSSTKKAIQNVNKSFRELSDTIKKFGS